MYIRTLPEIRADHLAHHCGFVWGCPHCGKEYWTASYYEKLTEVKMHTGMLWFDNSQKTLEGKIRGAMEYYQKKYGRTPDLVFVHPSMIPNQLEGAKLKTLLIDGLTVRPYRPVLPGHIWIGIEDKS